MYKYRKWALFVTQYEHQDQALIGIDGIWSESSCFLFAMQSGHELTPKSWNPGSKGLVCVAQF